MIMDHVSEQSLDAVGNRELKAAASGALETVSQARRVQYALPPSITNMT